jgi:hypothetical protein
MKLRARLLRLEKEVGPAPAPPPELTAAEWAPRIEGWLGKQTYGRGTFDADPEFRPAWSHNHRLGEIHTQGWSPLHAVWIVREQPDFEEARRQVVPIMARVLRRQPLPFRALAEALERTADGPPDPGR